MRNGHVGVTFIFDSLDLYRTCVAVSGIWRGTDIAEHVRETVVDGKPYWVLRTECKMHPSPIERAHGDVSGLIMPQTWREYPLAYAEHSTGLVRESSPTDQAFDRRPHLDHVAQHAIDSGFPVYEGVLENNRAPKDIIGASHFVFLYPRGAFEELIQEFELESENPTDYLISVTHYGEIYKAIIVDCEIRKTQSGGRKPFAPQKWITKASLILMGSYDRHWTLVKDNGARGDIKASMPFLMNPEAPQHKGRMRKPTGQHVKAQSAPSRAGGNHYVSKHESQQQELLRMLNNKANGLHRLTVALQKYLGGADSEAFKAAIMSARNAQEDEDFHPLWKLLDERKMADSAPQPA